MEVQRAYRARLAAAGKVVRIVDAVPEAPVLPSFPDFDPLRDGIYERAVITKMRDDLRNALLELELRNEDTVRLTQRNSYLEGELKRQEWHHTNALKELITLKQQLAERKPSKRR